MAADVKASDLLPLAKQALNEKWGYIWGGYGQIHTQKAQDNATREQTIKWGQRWVGKHVLDCSGLFYWAYKKNGGYMYHGCNTMWNKYSTAKGKLVNGKRDDGQDLKPGSAVYLVKDGNRHHVGIRNTDPPLLRGLRYVLHTAATIIPFRLTIGTKCCRAPSLVNSAAKMYH